MKEIENTPYMPVIRGLEILKRNESAADVEKTITDMYEIAHNMENQLHRVISINKLLEMDLKEAKAMIEDLKKENYDMQTKLKQIDDDNPSKKELQTELEHLIEERNLAQIEIHTMKNKVEDLQSQQSAYVRIKELEQNQYSMIEDINFLERKLEQTLKNIKAIEKENTVLKGENQTQIEKITSLEKELALSSEENEMLLRELTKSQAMLKDIRSKIYDADLEGLQGI
ncbi:magnetosome protein Mad25 [Candidatus Magnetoovum chiemensis]|nr:magnetosome protein Mad25 [Candidatus Magnetoovum chiemensis]